LGLLHHAHHSNVVCVFGWTVWKHSVAIIMEYMPGGYDIACGLAHIHRKGLVHSDIKPENILLDENLRCKIADFGCARLSALYTGYSMKSFASRVSNNFTYVYAAPELIENQCIDRHPSQDTFSFAIVIYVVFERDYKPATVAFPKDLYWHQVKSGVRPKFSVEVENRLGDSKEVELLLKTMRQCWSAKSQDRPDMSEVEKKLRNYYDNLDQESIATDVKNCKIAHKIIFLKQEEHDCSALTNYELPNKFTGKYLFRTNTVDITSLNDNSGQNLCEKKGPIGFASTPLKKAVQTLISIV